MRGAVNNYFWRLVHNALVHPLIGVFGERRWVMRLHEATGKRWIGGEAESE